MSFGRHFVRKIKQTAQFKRDLKREVKGLHRTTLEADLLSVIEALAADVALHVKHRDHALTGNWKHYRDCHVRPDLVLIYRLIDGDGTENDPGILVLARLGSHSQLTL